MNDDLVRDEPFLRRLHLSTFILAGGRGERLDPLTRDRAKPAVRFGGIYNVIDFTLSNCLNSGLRRVNVLTQYKSMSLANHIHSGWGMLSADLGEYIAVIPAQQRYGEVWYRGTADAIYQNFYTIQREDPEIVLVLAGDHIYKMDYSKMLAFHVGKEAEVTVACTEMPVETSSQFGVMEFDESGIIQSFQEKPKVATDPQKVNKIFVSMGIYLFNRDTLEQELIPAVEKEKLRDFGGDILPRILGKRRIFAYLFEDENRQGAPYWRDIGTLDSYYEANMDLVSVEPQFNLYDTRWPIRTRQRQSPPAKTVFRDPGEDARRGEALDSMISHGCVISGGSVIRSILSPQVRINSYATVEDSVIMDDVEIGRNCKIRRAIIDKRVRIDSDTRIGYDPDSDKRRFVMTDSGIVVVPAGSVVDTEQCISSWSDPVDRFRSRKS